MSDPDGLGAGRPGAAGWNRLWLWIACIVVVKALVMFLVLPHLSQWVSSSYGIGFADDYDRLALNLVQGNGYRFSPETAPTLLREPGYPLFLAGLFFFFGHSLAAVRIANLLLSAGAAQLLARLARDVGAEPRAAGVAGILLLVHPAIFVAELRGGVEILFATLLLGFLILLQRAVSGGRMRDYLLAGVALGVASSVRSTALLFPVLLPLVLWWALAKRRSFAVHIRDALLVMTGAVIVLTPWMVRNYALVGKLVPAATVFGHAAQTGQYICSRLTLHSRFQELDSQAARARAQLASERGYPFQDTGYYIYLFNARDEVELNGSLARRAMENYTRSPWLLGKCMSLNLFNFWFAGKSWTSTSINVLVQLPYLLLAGCGLVMAVRARKGPRIAIVVAFIIYYVGVHLPLFAQARYSVPLLPSLLVLAAVGLPQIGRVLGRRPARMEARFAGESDLQRQFSP